ncbi:MAG TPA: TolC family protein [Vicinamibacterales bacterium]|nr:TolC family protein [Vicinamibacterales bacterium]
MRTALILLAIIFSFTGTAAAQALSRAEAVAQALSVNPTVKMSLEQITLLEGRILEERAAALPDISWNTLAMRSRDPGLLNSPNFDEFPPEFREALRPLPGNAFSTTADVRQTLFSFKLGKALEAARVARGAGDQDVQRARQLTALDAIRAYNQLLFTMEQLRVIRTNVQSKQTHLDYARNRRAAGVATELEVLRAEVDLENARAEAIRAENEVTSARALLNTVMLRPTSAPVVPTDTLAVVPSVVDFEAAVKEALAARPDLQLLRTQERVRSLLIDVTAADAKPSVDFSGSYGFAVRRPKNLFDPDFSRWSAAINLRVPLFDGWRTAGRVAQARAQRNTVTQQIAALENQVRLDVQSAFDALTLADRTIQAAELNVAQARRATEMTEANYKLGAATQLDVVDAQQSLRQAENIRNQALYIHANARATLRFVMGRDPLE